jgi:hypothetical protein
MSAVMAVRQKVEMRVRVARWKTGVMQDLRMPTGVMAVTMAMIMRQVMQAMGGTRENVAMAAGTSLSAAPSTKYAPLNSYHDSHQQPIYSNPDHI